MTEAGMPLDAAAERKSACNLALPVTRLAPGRACGLAHDAEGLRLDHQIGAGVEQLVGDVVARNADAGNAVLGCELIGRWRGRRQQDRQQEAV